MGKCIFGYILRSAYLGWYGKYLHMYIGTYLGKKVPFVHPHLNTATYVVFESPKSIILFPTTSRRDAKPHTDAFSHATTVRPVSRHHLKSETSTSETMSTAEEQELMARIGNLAGRINRHKAEQNGHPSPAQPRTSPPHLLSTAPGIPVDPHTASDTTYSSRGSYRVAPYHPRGYRGGRGRGAPTYRNRTLVLNGQSRPATTNASAGTSVSTSASSEANPRNATPGGPSWVARTDRHMQLINSSVYEKESQNRAAAIEQTLRQKHLQKNLAERNRVSNYLNRASTTVGPASSNNPAQYELVVDGIRFHVIRQGSKLVRVPGTYSGCLLTHLLRLLTMSTSGDNNSASTTPRVAVVGGVKFYRTRNGNLVRHGIAKAQRYVGAPIQHHVLTQYRMAGGIKKVDEPCKTFSWTGIFFSKTIYDIANLALFCRLWCGKNPELTD